VSPARDRELPEGAAADGGRPLVIPPPHAARLTAQAGRPTPYAGRPTPQAVRGGPHAVRRTPSVAAISPTVPSQFRSPRGPGRVCLP